MLRLLLAYSWGPMPLFSSAAALRLVDAMAIALGQAYQLARVRLASADSPVLRLMVQRDDVVTDRELLRRELAILRGQRANTPPHRRPEYMPEQRLAILQLKRLRGWTLPQTAEHFVVHENTVRHWAQALEGQGHASLLTGTVVWNRIDDAVRWAVHELQRLGPEPEFGTRAIARHLVKAAVQISRSSVQRILRESPPAEPAAPEADSAKTHKPILEPPAGQTPDHLLVPEQISQVWHMDFTRIQILWMTFWIAAILDGFSRKFLALRVYRRTPGTPQALHVVRLAIREHGTPRFLITDHGGQFQQRFHAAVEEKLHLHHVQGRVRAPYLNGKMERAFRTLKLWWRYILTGCTESSIQKRMDDYRHWYNEHRLHSALGGRTPQQAWAGAVLPAPTPIRAVDPQRFHIAITRSKCRGDPRLRVLHITVRRQAA